MDPAIAKIDESAPASDRAAEDFLTGFISEEKYALQRRVSIRTCQRDRRLRKAPPFIQLGKQIYYRVDALRDWLIKRERVDTQQLKESPAGRRPQRSHVTKAIDAR